MNAWRPEIVVDAGMARRLIGQFTEVEIDTLRMLADGWDRAAWLANFAAFLRRLHSVELAEALGAADLPLDPNRRGEMTRRVEIARRYFASSRW